MLSRRSLFQVLSGAAAVVTGLVASKPGIASVWTTRRKGIKYPVWPEGLKFPPEVAANIEANNPFMRLTKQAMERTYEEMDHNLKQAIFSDEKSKTYIA